MKDLVEHIRTVHFTLLVVALILCAALQIEKKRPLERAAADAEAIRQLSEHWGDTKAALNTAFEEAFQEAKKEVQFRHPEALIAPRAGAYRADANLKKGGSVHLYFDVDSPWVFAQKTPDPAKMIVHGLSRWTTVNEFFHFWDLVQDGGVFLPLVLEPSNEATKCGKPLRQVVLGSTSDQLEEGFLYNEVRRSESVTPWVLSSSLSQDEPPLCSFPDQTLDAVRLNLVTAFRKVVPQAANWNAGKSSDEFSELIEESKYFEDSPIARLSNALRARANSDTERIEVFQAKLPASAIPTYGSLILLLCQIYLLAHLFEFQALLRTSELTEFPTGYIGLYQFKSIYVFVVISLVIFPVVPLALEVRQNIGRMRGLAVTALFAAFTLGLACSYVLSKARNELLKTPIVADSN